MVEMLHAAEVIRDLLNDARILGTDLMAEGASLLEGIGVIEAPRGTLFHHYKADERGCIVKANLIVSTTSNNRAMNESIRAVAAKEFDGREITEGLLNRIEVAIRAYDPCLSCATHAVGKMPLVVEAVGPDGALLSRLVRSPTGAVER
jgi:NAD-reducing hydrogenase large subunit